MKLILFWKTREEIVSVLFVFSDKSEEFFKMNKIILHFCGTDDRIYHPNKNISSKLFNQSNKFNF